MLPADSFHPAPQVNLLFNVVETSQRGIKNPFIPHVVFHAGKLRDELGRDVIDAGLVSKGPRQAAKELNERSPQMSPRVNKSKERSRRRFGETSSSDEADRQSL